MMFNVIRHFRYRGSDVVWSALIFLGCTSANPVMVCLDFLLNRIGSGNMDKTNLGQQCKDTFQWTWVIGTIQTYWPISCMYTTMCGHMTRFLQLHCNNAIWWQYIWNKMYVLFLLHTKNCMYCIKQLCNFCPSIII